MNMHNYAETHLDVKKEAKGILGNNNPTHFLSFLAVSCNELECTHAHEMWCLSVRERQF